MNKVLFGIILLGILQPAINTKGQLLEDNKLKYQQAEQELESILNLSDRIDNPLATVKVKAKVAGLIWLKSPEKARSIFTNLWNFIDKQSNESLNKEEARIAVLRHLLPKDRKLANQLLQKAALQDKDNDKETPAFDKINGNDKKTRRLAFLANRLADTDPILAAQIFEQSFVDRTSPITPGILGKIKSKDPQLANYLASRMLENFNRQPRTIAIIGLTGLSDYIFPLIPFTPLSGESPEADETLHLQFMSVGYPILKESLAETDEFLIREQQFTKESLKFRPLFQAFLAGTLAALSESYAPEYFAELTAITNNLLTQLPEPIAATVRAKSALVKSKIGTPNDPGTSEISETQIFGAIAKGEFKIAENLIGELKDENKKRSLTELLLKAQGKFHLTNGDLLDALNSARKIENPAQRMLLLAEIAKVANKKRDVVLSTDILTEARKTSGESLPKIIHATTLFAISSEAIYFSPTEAMLIVEEAVEIVNSMPNPEKENTGKTVIVDSDRFIDSTEMMKAFSSIGEKNMESALMIAGKLKNKYVEMTAKLACIEKILKKGLPKTKSETNKSKSPKVN